MDRFLIEWGYIDDTNSTIYTDKAYLNVEVVLGVNTIKNQEICRGVVQADKNIKVYIGLIGVNKTKIKELQQEIREYQEMPKPMTISMPVAVFLAVIAFVLGYMIF